MRPPSAAEFERMSAPMRRMWIETTQASDLTRRLVLQMQCNDAETVRSAAVAYYTDPPDLVRARRERLTR